MPLNAIPVSIETPGSVCTMVHTQKLHALKGLIICGYSVRVFPGTFSADGIVQLGIMPCRRQHHTALLAEV